MANKDSEIQGIKDSKIQIILFATIETHILLRTVLINKT